MTEIFVILTQVTEALFILFSQFIFSLLLKLNNFQCSFSIHWFLLMPWYSTVESIHCIFKLFYRSILKALWLFFRSRISVPRIYIFPLFQVCLQLLIEAFYNRCSQIFVMFPISLFFWCWHFLSFSFSFGLIFLVLGILNGFFINSWIFCILCYGVLNLNSLKMSSIKI